MVEPELPEEFQIGQLAPELRQELRTLSKENAEGVGRHLLAATAALADEDLDRALAHAEAAVRRAGRVAVVRETLGLVHYRRAEWGKSLGELRTARRLSGSHHLLPLMVDCERGMGRAERALDLAGTPEAGALGQTERRELAIVVAGARLDLGQADAAVLHLRPWVEAGSAGEAVPARLAYAYADALQATGRDGLAREWMERAADADLHQETDAGERLGRMGDDELVDLDEGAEPIDE